MRRLVVIAVLFALLLGCSALGTPVTRDNNLVQMPHYTFTVPADQGWHMQRADGNFESVVLVNKVGPILFQMRFMRNVVLHSSMRAQPANVVADDFRRLEERIMIEQGVKRGQYQLKDLLKGVRTLGDRTFYTMTYEAVASTGTQFAALYLLFPKSAGNDSFIVAHYSEFIPPSTGLVKSYKADFEALLQGMVLQ